MTASLPQSPSLVQLRRQAKDLVKAFAAHDPEAVRRAQVHPTLARTSGDDYVLTLSEAQLIVAREHGFASWTKLKQHVEAAGLDEEAALAAFSAAVKALDAVKLRKLLIANPDLRNHIDDRIFFFDSPAVLVASSRKSRDLMDLLLEFGADINARSTWWAGGFGVLPNDDPEFAAYLVERGAVIDVWAAAAMNRIDLLEKLIAEDPSRVNARGGDGQSPLHFAGSVEVAAWLLARGAQIDMRDLDHGSTAAQTLVARRPEVSRYLVEHGAELDIFMAVQLGDIELVRRALREDPNAIHARVNEGKLISDGSDGGHIYVYTLADGRNPLFLAAILGRTAIYELLLRESSPADALIASCLAEDESAARAIVREHPGLVRSLPVEQMCLIGHVAWKHKTAAVALMLELGFDVDAHTDHDSAALNRAAIRGYADLIELLLRNGASMTLKNEYGGTPTSACIWGSENFRDPNGDYAASIDLLLAAKPPLWAIRYPCTDKRVSARVRDHLTKLAKRSLVAAVELGSEAKTRTLLETDLNSANAPEDGILPLHQAVRQGSETIVKLLLEHGASVRLTETQDGPTLQDFAKETGNAAVIEMISKAPNIPTGTGA